jgi:hypothetical protein
MSSAVLGGYGPPGEKARKLAQPRVSSIMLQVFYDAMEWPIYALCFKPKSISTAPPPKWHPAIL